MLAGFSFAARALVCGSWVRGVMCNIRCYVIITGISVIDLLIEAIIGVIVVNDTMEASSFFGTSVGK